MILSLDASFLGAFRDGFGGVENDQIPVMRPAVEACPASLPPGEASQRGRRLECLGVVLGENGEAGVAAAKPSNSKIHIPDGLWSNMA